MKKTVSVFVLFLWLAFTADAQINPHAIGIRLNGDGAGNGLELSYQHGFGARNRLELDLGLRSHSDWLHLGVTGIFHWVWNLNGGLNWFIGPGAQVGFYNNRGNDDDGVNVAVGGQVGLEYDFNSLGAPILVGLDWRPMWDLFGSYSGFAHGLGLSVRYTF